MAPRRILLALLAAGALPSGCSPDSSADAAADPDATPDSGPPGPDDAGEGGADGAVGACAPGAPLPESGERTLLVDGRERSFLLHVPAGHPGGPMPLVLNFHGFTSDPAAQEEYSVMDEVADREGFAVAYPAGTGTPRGFNAGVCCGLAAAEQVDDVAFAAAIIDAVSAELCVDPARVYSTGLSNGGFLSYRLACELSDRIAAIAPVAGVMGVSDCEPGRAVPVLHFHGTADAVVPMGGNAVLGFPPVQETVDGWLERDGCTGEGEITFQQGDATCRRWSDCAEGSAVELCIIDGGGHTWPGGRVPAIAGKTSQDLSASDYMWQFFSEHPLAGG